MVGGTAGKASGKGKGRRERGEREERGKWDRRDFVIGGERKKGRGRGGGGWSCDVVTGEYLDAP